MALFRRVDREQVQGAAHDEPQHLRPLQRKPSQTVAVDLFAEPSQGADDRVVLCGGRVRARAREMVNGCHLSAP